MHSIGKRQTCDRCRYTPGVVKVGKRYERCHCGKLPNSTNEWKLTEQARLDRRLQDLKEGKPW